MKIIYKYEIATDDCLTIGIPEGSTILSVQMQNKIPCLWILLDPSKPEVKRTFKIIGTGWKIGGSIDCSDYIGTWQDDAYVWHLFEI